jgi:hypothetical protein
MALIPSESPNINVREFDLSGVVPAVTTSTGAIAGEFAWGPVEQPILVGNEAELVSNFGAPGLDSDVSTATDFLTASTFLKYSSNTYVTRVYADSDRNSVAAGDSQLIKNLDDFTSKQSGLTANKVIAKYPGSVGNSLKVSVFTGTTSDSDFNAWAYSSYFDGKPGTSDYVSNLSADSSVALDEVHVAVIDEDGLLSGTAGTVLETFPYASVVSDAKTDFGATNYVVDVLNNKSSYVWATSFAADITNAGVTATNWVATDSDAGITVNMSLSGGVQRAKNVGDYQQGFDQYADADTIQVDFLIAPQMGSTDDQVTIANYLAAIASTTRKDCVAVTSPPRESVVGVSNSATVVSNTVTFANRLTNTSYLVIDNNFVKVYDKYNDEYVFIPAASSTAGIMAATDNVAAPWFSPAGQRRGQYLGVTSLAYSPTQSQRDTLYKASVNPIVNLPGQGILLYGDKTNQGRPSAFDRINVRRLFLAIERAIKGAAQNVMFEFNDEFTRAEFVNAVEPFLREVKGRRGITDFRVVCDETNNTSDVIDNNQFVATVFVKPARSINYVTLNFVAVRTGVDFEEVAGLV